MSDSAPSGTAPALSVIVPTLDRPESLRACLRALDRQTVAGAMEVIVEEGHQGPAAARNAGAATARAPLLAFIDDDCEPDPGWAAALLARHEEEPEALIGGRTLNGLPGNRFSAASQAITEAALAHHNGGPGGPTFFPSNNVAVPADAFADLGGFDEGVRRAGGEDRDLCERWIESGRSMAEAPDALVHHSHPLGIGGFWRQHAAYGGGAHAHRAARASRTGDRRIEPSLTSGVFAIAARRAIADRDPARLGLLAVWQAANMAGYLGAAVSSRRG
jgi:GT2 family glycosyltransferase